MNSSQAFISHCFGNNIKLGSDYAKHMIRILHNSFRSVEIVFPSEVILAIVLIWQVGNVTDTIME